MKYLLLVFLGTFMTFAHAVEQLQPDELNAIRQKAPGLKSARIVGTLLPDYAILKDDPNEKVFPTLLKKDMTIAAFRHRPNGVMTDYLTPQELAKERAEQFSKMDKSQMVTVKYGDGRAKLLIISAINCPTCKQLEGTLAKRAGEINATIYYIPVSLNEEDDIRTTALWCASGDKGKAWLDWWRGIRQHDDPKCRYTLEDRMALWMFFGFSSPRKPFSPTPTIVREDGSQYLGFPVGDEFLDWFGGKR